MRTTNGPAHSPNNRDKTCCCTSSNSCNNIPNNSNNRNSNYSRNNNSRGNFSDQRLLLLLQPLLLLLFLCVTAVTTERQAGVWIDDGYGHTVKEPLSLQESREFSHSLRLTMGLPDHGPPPHRGPRRHNIEASAQTFMKSIYNTLDEHGVPRGTSLDPGHKEALEKADTVVSFVSKTTPERGEAPPKHHSHHRILFFDTSDVSMEHTLLGAELRIHYQPRRPLYMDQYLKQSLASSLLLHVYLVIDAEGGEVEVAQTTLSTEGWLSLNVTAPALAWMLQPRDNRGFRLAVTADGRKHEQKLQSVGISTSHDREDHQPILVCFFSLPEGSTAHPTIGNSLVFKSLAVSSAGEQNILERSIRSALPVSSRGHGYAAPVARSERSCQMRPLHVSFQDIHWQHWVIAPDGYDANFCDGLCNFPMPAEMNATNHAIVQTLIKVLGAVKEGDRLPPAACCTPKDLATISVLYYDYSNNVVLKKFPKMIVKNCACR